MKDCHIVRLQHRSNQHVRPTRQRMVSIAFPFNAVIRIVSCMPDTELRVSTAPYRTNNRSSPLHTSRMTIFTPPLQWTLKGGEVSILSNVYLLGGRPREPDEFTRHVLHAPPVAVAIMRPEQLVRNVICSWTWIE